jgi:hypothetical protein
MKMDKAIAAVLNLDYRLIPLSFRPVPFWDEGLNGRFTKATKEASGPSHVMSLRARSTELG